MQLVPLLHVKLTEFSHTKMAGSTHNYRSLSWTSVNVLTDHELSHNHWRPLGPAGGAYSVNCECHMVDINAIRCAISCTPYWPTRHAAMYAWCHVKNPTPSINTQSKVVPNLILIDLKWRSRRVFWRASPNNNSKISSDMGSVPDP